MGQLKLDSLSLFLIGLCPNDKIIAFAQYCIVTFGAVQIIRIKDSRGSILPSPQQVQLSHDQSIFGYSSKPKLYQQRARK